MKHLVTLSAFAALFLFSTTAFASTPVNSEDNATGTVLMEDAYASKAMTKAELRAQRKADKEALKAEKKMIRMEKRMAKLNKMLAKKMNKKALGGFDDPIDKFLWFGIIAAAAAIIFSVIPGLWWLGTIFWIGAVVLVVIWVIKKYA